MKIVVNNSNFVFSVNVNVYRSEDAITGYITDNGQLIENPAFYNVELDVSGGDVIRWKKTDSALGTQYGAFRYNGIDWWGIRYSSEKGGLLVEMDKYYQLTLPLGCDKIKLNLPVEEYESFFITINNNLP